MRVGVAVDRTGVPVGVATDAAGVAETVLGPAALDSIPAAVGVPSGPPALGDKGCGSGPLRECLVDEGYRPVARHRRSRVEPPPAGGRVCRRLRRRWVAARTLAWPHSFRRVATGYGRRVALYDGLVHPARAFIALGRLVK